MLSKTVFLIKYRFHLFQSCRDPKITSCLQLLQQLLHIIPQGAVSDGDNIRTWLCNVIQHEVLVVSCDRVTTQVI